MDQSINDLMKREKAAWSDKTQWSALYDDAYALARPQMNLQNETKGAVKQATVYDSTLQNSTVKLASLLQSTITPPFTEWAKLIPGPFLTENRDEAIKKLEYISKAVFAAIGISSFDAAIGEFYLDYIIGTGAMLVLEGDDTNPLKFITVPIQQLALEEGPDSEIGGIFRRYKKPARTIRQMWPDMEDSETIAKFENEDPGKSISIAEITYWDPEDSVWRYNVLLTSTGEGQQAERIVSRTYDTNPWIIGRWLKAAGEVFGRGPVLNALPDAKTCNMAKKLELQNAALAISGVWIARNNGVINGNTIRIVPGAVIPVLSTGGPQGSDLQRLDAGGDLNYSQIIQKDLQQSIKDAMFDRSIPEQGAVRSASEWVIRGQQLQEAIGAPFSRMFHEVLRPLFNRMLAILTQKGIIDEIVVNGGTVNIQIIGPLAQSQALQEVESIMQWGSMSQQLAGPEIWQASAKVENIPQVLSESLGIPSQLLRSEKEKMELAQAAQQAMAQQQEGGEQPQ